MKKGEKRTLSTLPVSQCIPIDGNVEKILPEPIVAETNEVSNKKTRWSKLRHHKKSSK